MYGRKLQEHRHYNKDPSRPHAGNGLWLAGLLFLSHAINVWNRDKVPVSLNYKRSTILCFGLLLHSVGIFVSLSNQTRQRFIGKLLYVFSSLGLTSFLLWICLKDNVVISTVSAIFGIILYDRVFLRVLKQMPKCFTLGEATLVCQGFTIFAYNVFLQVPKVLIDKEPSPDLNIMHIVLQVILLGICIIVALCHLLPMFRNTILFYLLTTVISTCTALFPVFGHPTVVVLFKFVLSDMERMLVIALYMFLLLVTSAFVVWQINRKTNANTTTRKIFHILILLVYLPGLWSQCTLLHLASGLMLGMLLMLETARVIQLKPVYQSLDQVVKCFIDEKDAGMIALTPIYLLVGCSLPIWLHPVPCDLTDSGGLNLLKLLAGVLSVGIGDTMASVCGYLFGKHTWPGSVKSVEGTISSIIGQAGVVFLLFRFSYVHLNTLRAATAGAAIIINALVEAKTSQVDNLVLPLVTYVVLGTA
ncbi:dolichol kinase isoform X2 [Ochlerotatus camptorhynchus]|uniref:dolichol kinase isoform X2 n=1 Tax=Ochlerotatus camptorhynchus TaxID=644619 RepID=UPI0031D124E2